MKDYENGMRAGISIMIDQIEFAVNVFREFSKLNDKPSCNDDPYVNYLEGQQSAFNRAADYLERIVKSHKEGMRNGYHTESSDDSVGLTRKG